MDYFNSTTVCFKDRNNALEELMQQKFPEISSDESSRDFIYLDHLSEKNLEFLKKVDGLKNDTIIFVNAIHKNYNHWNKLIALKKVTVSIDTFYCGMLFFRREQAKEHFKIRI
ncbi:hypothetical protein [Cellulophaga sp. L1A9]|uniref:hypothetical protein n=1 Tax=Cellulophaga sp. L1A9 TaxID=2686362 RepID=UPI00131C4467|nr:hypothetical protein [Cellulophaga sp. L1A9]